MDFASVVLGVGLLVIILLAVLLAFSDCDLTLRYCELFGKPPKSLAGKVVWVTGASSGIGQALAVELAQAGCRLVLSARREDRLKQTRQLCIDGNPSLRSEDVLVLPLDLVDYSSHTAAVETVIKYFKQIDVLVNNAGRSQRGLFDETSLDVIRELFEVDLFAQLSLTKEVLPHMTSRGQGHILVTSSVAGKIGAPGQATYVGAKFALQGLFDAIRVEAYPHNIRVTIACPGFVFSDILYHAFTGTPGKKLEVAMQPTWKRMTAERCARLMSVAVANNLDEAWISGHPELLYLYLFQYMPYFAKKVSARLGQKRIQNMRENQDYSR